MFVSFLTNASENGLALTFGARRRRKLEDGWASKGDSDAVRDERRRNLVPGLRVFGSGLILRGDWVRRAVAKMNAGVAEALLTQLRLKSA